MKRLSNCVIAIFAIALGGCVAANPNDKLHDMPANTGFNVYTVTNENGVHKYSVFVPRDYNASQKYPAIVFLHGIGESGNDGVKCTTAGLGPAIAKRNGNFPFIVIFPQAGWDWTSKEAGQTCISALNDAEKHYSIDADRVTLTGVSSGGKGVWVLGARYIDRWNALVPMAGYAAEDEVPKLTKIPIWCLHNSGDFIVPVGGSRSMFKKIKAAGGNIQYKEFDAIGHDCWDNAYGNSELFDWMLAQRRAR